MSAASSATASSAAVAMPTIPATSWVPLRRPRSWPPPKTSGSIRTGRPRRRTHRHPTPLGPWNLCAEKLARSAPRASTSTGIRPRAWDASTWRSPPRARTIAAIGRTSWTTPISLLAKSTETRNVSSSHAASIVAGSILPAKPGRDCGTTGSRSTEKPRRARWSSVSSTAGCSVASVSILPGRPSRNPCRDAAPWRARLIASVAPEVNTISRGSAPTAAAIRAREASTASRASRPMACVALPALP